MKKSQLFRLDPQAEKIISLNEDVVKLLRLNMISVTVDQPQYWPWETVHLKAILPDRPKAEVEITIQKRDAAPRELGSFVLGEEGILVREILSGKKERLELGEYKVNLRTADKAIQGTAEFSVVEGALGAVSFAYEFRQLTAAEELAKAKGGWFMGNASGAGLRWGNGLNIRNELRISNQPYNGKVTLRSRCFLPGCNGVEAGPPKTLEVRGGLIEAVVEVGGHSGPFEVEATTDRGSVKYLFEASGHVERQMVPLSSGMTYLYRAGLAPYEGTTQVPGRQIFIDKEKREKDDALELVSAFSQADNKITLIVRKALENAKTYVLKPESGGKFIPQEFANSTKLAAGEEIIIPIKGPYSLIAVGGYLGDKANFWEGYAITFTPSGLKVDLESPQAGNPNSTFNVRISTQKTDSQEGISIAGVLEVFDNRVASKSPATPLASAIGDSFRNASNALSSWEDRAELAEVKILSRQPRQKMEVMTNTFMPPLSPASGKVPEEAGAEGETLRQGEEKIVFCEMVRTNVEGKADVEIKLPPQTGRCNIRFVAARDLDYAAGQKTIDVTKKTYVECHLQPLLVLGCKVIASCYAYDADEKNMLLKISGACLDKPLSYQIKSGGREIEFSLEGKNYGKLILELTDSLGRLQDRRELELRDISSQPVTFSHLIISENRAVEVELGETAAIYANAGQLLKNMVMSITTTMYSWFGHAEALSAQASVRAVLLQVIDKGIVDDDGLYETLRIELEKTVRDLEERFFDRSSGLFSPYPGMPTNTLWSAWTARNLNSMVEALKKSPRISSGFSQTIQTAEAMISQVNQALEKLGESIPELAGFDPKQSDREVIPVEIEGKVYYRVLTDDAVVQWAAKKLIPALDTQRQSLDDAFAKAYDTWRFLRTFEHTGLLPYLIQNAKALWLAGEKERAHFNELFSQIAKGAIAAQESGMMQGPALLGGVYSSPQTMVRFLELLAMMSEESIPETSEVRIIKEGSEETLALTDKPVTVKAIDTNLRILAPQYAVIRFDVKKTVAFSDYVSNEAFFRIVLEKNRLGMAEETRLFIDLDETKDPLEYYAIVALPSTVSLRQTEDLLSDYKGQLLYGQKASGGAEIQLVTVPFRGSRHMILRLEASQKGVSAGWVLVRHINDPDEIATLKTQELEVY